MRDEPKACVFCLSRETTITDSYESFGIVPKIYYVKCWCCGACGPKSENEKGAIKSWNKGLNVKSND